MKNLRRLAPVALALSAALAAPALAQAKAQSATVLRVDRARHHVELVSGKHVVRTYVLSGKLARKLSRGSVISFSARGKRITKVRVKGHARKLAFYATVVSNRKGGVVLRLADGRRVRIGGKKRAHHAARTATAAASVSINVQGLKVGQVVLITEALDANGNLTITLTLVQQADPTGGEDQDAIGTVTAVAADGSTLTVQVDGQSAPMTFQTDSDLVDGISVGDQVDVTYYQDTDGSLVADDVEPADGSGDGSSSTGGDHDAIGTVTAVAADGSTLTVQVDGQSAPTTFQTDSDLVDGISVGDQVDVTYYQDTDGSLVADDVQPVDDSASGDGSSGDASSGDDSGE